MITLPITSPRSLKKFLDENKGLVYRYVLQELKYGIEADLDRVDILAFGSTAYRASIIVEDFAVAIGEAQDYFIEQEMYEEAAVCRDLLLKINLEIEFSETTR